MYGGTGYKGVELGKDVDGCGKSLVGVGVKVGFKKKKRRKLAPSSEAPS